MIQTVISSWQPYNVGLIVIIKDRYNIGRGTKSLYQFCLLALIVFFLILHQYNISINNISFLLLNF